MRNGKSCAPPFDSPPSVCQPTPYNFNSMRRSDQQFVLSAQWNWNSFPQQSSDFFYFFIFLLLTPKRLDISFVFAIENISHIPWFNWSHITCCMASITRRLQTWEAGDFWIIYISRHRLVWFQRKLPVAHYLSLVCTGRWDIFSLIACFPDSCG